MKPEDNPCYGCTERVVGCHSTCEAYHGFQKRNAERNNTIYDSKKGDFAFDGYTKHKIKALIRAKGERKR